jgi:hypothetical protein
MKTIARQWTQATALLALLWLAAACSRPAVSPWPEEAAMQVLELRAVRIDPADFHNSWSGKPLDLKVSLLDNGRVVPPVEELRIRGSRGERSLDKPQRWLVEARPDHAYQIIVEERARITRGARWEVPPMPEMGHWIFAENEGRLSFGQGSALIFRTRPLGE